jgi:YD repeat-containing protein
MFGIPFPPLRERMDRFEAGARAIRALWRGTPVTLEQPYTPLVDAQSFPLPAGGRLVVGRGERRTMRVAAELADEWNVTRVTYDEYPRKLEVLDAIRGRVPGVPVIVITGVDDPSVRTRARQCQVSLLLKPFGLDVLKAVLVDALYARFSAPSG